jgi:hypothetical protein
VGKEGFKIDDQIFDHLEAENWLNLNRMIVAKFLDKHFAG